MSIPSNPPGSSPTGAESATAVPLPNWLRWAREIQSLSQTGLAYSESDYATQRYRRLLEIAADMVAVHTRQAAAAILQNFEIQPGYATPKVDVRGAVVREGRILLVREKSDGCWCLPGGWADVGETPSGMVVREVREESGLEIKPVKVIGVYDANRSGTPLSFYHAYKIVFLCEILGGSPQAGDETLEARFFSFDQLPPLSAERTHERHLRDIQFHLEDPSRPVAFD